MSTARCRLIQVMPPIPARPIRLRTVAVLALAVLLSACQAPATAAECASASGAQRVALIELYTSEGCSSCPPADRWLGGLLRSASVPSALLPLAFHVDYWNELGWRDPFSQAKFSDRQREYSRRRNQRFVFTPQFLLDGQPYSRPLLIDDITRRTMAINRSRPRADLRLRHTRSADRIDFSVEARATDPEARQSQLFVALYENNLLSNVLSGENRGAQLAHEFVVRELVGPVALDTAGIATHGGTLPLDARWKPGDLQLAAFVQHPRTGEVMQALVGTCR